MDRLAEYIPFVLILGYIVISIRKNWGKTREEELSKTTLPGRKSGEVITIPGAVPAKKKKVEAHPNNQPTPVVVRPAIVIPEEPTQLLEMEDADEAVELSFDVEDVKKAVIYAEVLNRKY